MGAEIETAELDRILLPPIPGPLPPSFFTDISPGSAAVFSTLLGTKPFRLLPNPAPVHAIHSSSEDDIRNKSYYFFKRFPAIAESIIIPPAAWQDLYHYFDAADLWSEGAGFLFHVLGHIVRVNLTKLNLLEQFAREWASLNEARLASMVPRQDMLSALQTPDDYAWFDYANMTSHDKEILNAVLYRHCEASQAKCISAPAAAQNEPLQVAVEAQRILPAMNLSGSVPAAVDTQRVQSAIHPRAPIQIVVEPQRVPYDIAADPYQHFGRPDYLIPPGLSHRSSQPIPLHLESSENNARASSILQYRDSQSYGTHGESFYKTTHPVAPRNCQNNAENFYISPNGYSQVAVDRRQNAHAGNSYRTLQRQLSMSKDPVYMLNPQKSLMSLHKEAFGVQGGNYSRTPPGYSFQRPQNVNFPGRNSQDRRDDLQFLNQPAKRSNDARLHYDGRFNPVDGSTRSMPRDSFKQTSRKISWPESDFKKVRTVYVDGFPVEASSGYHLEKLFSECGEITMVSVIYEKFYAFITFKYPGSALAAISRFDGYSIEGGKSLKVQPYKAHQRKSSYADTNSQQPTTGASLQSWANDVPPSLIQDRCYESRENRKFTRTTPPRNGDYSLPNPSQNLSPHPFEQARDSSDIAQTAISALEPKYFESQLPLSLPAKPQYSFPSLTWSGSPSTISKPQPNYAQGSTRTPDRNQRDLGARQMSTTGGKDSVDRSSQTGGRRPHGSESSKTKRKTPKKQKGPPNDRKAPKFRGSPDALNSNLQKNTPTHSPGKGVPLMSAGSPSAESRNANLISSNALAAPSTQPKADDNIADNFIANDNVRQLQYFSGCSSQCTKADSSTSNSDARSDSISSISSTGPGCRSVLGQRSGLCAITDADTGILSSETVPAAAAKIASGLAFRIKEPPIDRKESVTSNELVQQQEKKKSKYKKKSPNQSGGNNFEITGDSSVPQVLENLPSDEAREIYKVEARSHLKTSSNTSSSCTTSTSTQLTRANAETAVSPTQKRSNKKASPGRNAFGDCTPRESPTRQSHRTKRSTQSKPSNGDDVFQDTKAATIKHTQDVKRLSQGQPGTNGPATPSTSNSNSSSKNARNNSSEDTQTPTRRPQQRHRINKSDPKVMVPNRQENKKPLPSPIEILSDPSNWPALGSTALLIDTKAGSIQRAPPTVKPLGERPLPPVPIRRDSMASVISQPPQVVRRLTIDSPNSPMSGGSPLWPVVKRWDGHGRPLVENGDSTSLTSGHT